ncbi:MAG: CDC27 family protein [Sulfurospirillaceae bacterium]|nr:CDC27 family protein [Sulfurospirillaceae bacterium]
MTNRAFEDLERRCTALNRKIFLKWFLLIFIILALIGFGLFEFFFVSATQISHVVPLKKVENNVSKIKRVIPKLKVVAKKIDTNKTILKKEESNITVKPQDYKTLLLKPNIVIPKINQKIQEVNTTIKKDKIQPKVTEVKKDKIVVPDKNISLKQADKIHISVTTMPSEESLIETNSKDEDFDSAFKLAQYYFKNQKYEKAIFYSKKANHFNPTSAKPWLVYARAKIKEHKRDEAIKALETYLSYFSSDDVENLLISIKGKK